MYCGLVIYLLKMPLAHCLSPCLSFISQTEEFRYFHQCMKLLLSAGLCCYPVGSHYMLHGCTSIRSAAWASSVRDAKTRCLQQVSSKQYTPHINPWTPEPSQVRLRVTMTLFCLNAPNWTQNFMLSLLSRSGGHSLLSLLKHCLLRSWKLSDMVTLQKYSWCLLFQSVWVVPGHPGAGPWSPPTISGKVANVYSHHVTDEGSQHGPQLPQVMST